MPELSRALSGGSFRTQPTRVWRLLDRFQGPYGIPSISSCEGRISGLCQNRQNLPRNNPKMDLSRPDWVWTSASYLRTFIFQLSLAVLAGTEAV